MTRIRNETAMKGAPDERRRVGEAAQAVVGLPEVRWMMAVKAAKWEI